MSVTEIPPGIPKDKVPSDGCDFKVTEMREVRDIQTSMGVVHRGLNVWGKLPGDNSVYSQLWSLDKEQITGSAGRVLTKLGIKHVDEITEKTLAKAKGMVLRVQNRGGKLYWS